MKKTFETNFQKSGLITSGKLLSVDWTEPKIRSSRDFPGRAYEEIFGPKKISEQKFIPRT